VQPCKMTRWLLPLPQFGGLSYINVIIHVVAFGWPGFPKSGAALAIKAPQFFSKCVSYVLQ